MRLIVLVVTALAMIGCPPPPPDDPPDTKGDPNFPKGWESWDHVNSDTIIREDEGVAREIYAKTAANIGHGSVIVKAQYRLAGSNKGSLYELAVMRRIGGADNGGWSFETYDPASRQRTKTDVSACVGCHILRAESGYLFLPQQQYE